MLSNSPQVRRGELPRLMAKRDFGSAVLSATVLGLSEAAGFTRLGPRRQTMPIDTPYQAIALRLSAGESSGDPQHGGRTNGTEVRTGSPRIRRSRPHRVRFWANNGAVAPSCPPVSLGVSGGGGGQLRKRGSAALALGGRPTDGRSLTAVPRPRRDEKSGSMPRSSLYASP